MEATEYTGKELAREARNTVKGRGKMLSWSLRIPRNGEPHLAIYYIPKGDVAATLATCLI